jgi:hypothetical protein
VLVRVDPQNEAVLGFSILNFKAWHAEHADADGSFEVDLPPDLTPALDQVPACRLPDWPDMSRRPCDYEVRAVQRDVVDRQPPPGLAPPAPTNLYAMADDGFPEDPSPGIAP